MADADVDVGESCVVAKLNMKERPCRSYWNWNGSRNEKNDRKKTRS
jgi:hypothetical protein